MIAKRSLLRAIVNREVRLKGEFIQSPTEITVKDFQVFNLQRGDYTENSAASEGDSLNITPSIMITVAGDHPILLKTHPLLYECGIVSLIPIVDKHDGCVSPTIKFECHREIDLLQLPYILRMYVAE